MSETSWIHEVQANTQHLCNSIRTHRTYRKGSLPIWQYLSTLLTLWAAIVFLFWHAYSSQSYIQFLLWRLLPLSVRLDLGSSLNVPLAMSTPMDVVPIYALLWMAVLRSRTITMNCRRNLSWMLVPLGRLIPKYIQCHSVWSWYWANCSRCYV